jgi:hypothetical protein
LCGGNVVQFRGLFNSTALLQNRASLLPLDRNLCGPQGLSKYGDEDTNIGPRSYQPYSLSINGQLILIFHTSWHSTEKVKKTYRRQMKFTFTLPCIVIDFFLNNQTDALIIPNLFCYKTLHVSGIFSAHHQEFSTVYSVLVSFMQV